MSERIQTFKENTKRKCQKVLLAITEKAKMEIKINNKNKKNLQADIERERKGRAGVENLAKALQVL